MTAPALRLYEATEQLDVVRDWLIESGGELTPEIEALLEEAQETFQRKAERVALFIQELAATAAAVRQERERLERLEKSYENGVKSLKRYLQVQMERAEIERIDGDLVKIRLQKSAPSVHGELSEEMLRRLAEANSPYVRVIPAQYQLDKRGIIEVWKETPSLLPAGITVEQGRHIRID